MKTCVSLFVVLIATAVFTFSQDSGSAARSASNSGALPPALSGTGTPNHITKWITTTSIGNSGILETGTGNVGIGTTTPAAKFDLKGTGDVRDTLTLFPAGTHPTISISGTAFQISNIGKVTFVAGQTFPGTGTVTTVNSGTGLIGGPIHTTGTLSVNPSVIPFLAKANVFTANQTIHGFLLTNDLFVNGSAAGLVGEGGNPTPGQPGNSLTVFGGSPSSPATDVAGGDLVLAGGNGFGAGGGGGVRIQTAPAGPSGSTSDTLVDRQVFASKSAPMGGQSGSASIFLLNPANGDGAGATVRFTINANDGAGNFAAETGSCIIAVVASASGSASAIALRFGADGTDTGGVNASCDIIPGSSGNENGIAVGDNLNFVPTTHVIYFEIDNVSGSPLITLLPGARAPRRLRRRVDLLHPTLVVRRSR
jgi:hypothetical protein